MKKSYRYLWFLSILLVLILSSCPVALDLSEGGTGLNIQLQDSLSRLLAPALDMDADSVIITITSPDGSSQEYPVNPGESLYVKNLLHGSYGILAEAYNIDGILIGRASVKAQVNSGETTTVFLDIRPLEGTGYLDISLFWNPAHIQFPVVEASLLNSDGLVIPFDFPEEGGEAHAEIELDSGYYILSVLLFDGDFLSFGRMEIVRILSGETTSGVFDFSDANINGGSIDVQINMELENPLYPIIGNMAEIVGVSEPLVLSAGVDGNIPGVSYVWYLMGESVEVGETFVFSSESPGSYRIDLAAFSSDGGRAGSTGFTIYVSDQVQNFTSIGSVQGASHVSPYDGDTVENVLGVVTAVEDRGFWMQSSTGDGDPATSDGIYVYTYSSHPYITGDLVAVDGTVAEYGFTGDLKLTELTFVTVELITSGYPQPDSTRIGAGGILPPSMIICNDAIGTVYNSVFDPGEDGIDFFESLEGMLVEIDNPLTVGGTKYGEIPVIPTGLSYNQSTARGGLYLSENNANPQILHIDTDADILGLDPVTANLGDYFTAPVTGIVNYSYGKFIVMPTVLPPISSNAVARESSGLSPGDTNLTVATFNIENFPRNDDDMSSVEIQAKIDEIAFTIANALNSPDLVGLQEMTDDSYSSDDGVVSAAANYGQLINSISFQGGPGYEFLEIPPVDLQEGGWPGANIRVGFLYNPARVGFTPSGIPDSTSETSVVDTIDGPSLTLNPGRFAVNAFVDSRKSLIAQFTFMGESVFIINNHFNSKSGDDSLFGENQPPIRSSETERHTQAAAVRDLVDDIRGLDNEARVIVLGDLNDFQFSETVEILEQSGVSSLTGTLLPENEQYSYIFNGNSQQLDHILASPSLMANAEVDIVHRYAEFDQFQRSTDHDPVLASFDFAVAPVPAEPFFSEYAEGSSNNKYLEIYNPGTADLQLDGYLIRRFNNGSIDVSSTSELSGVLAAGEVYVIANASADALITDVGDTTHSTATFYNGDDCLQLLNPAGDILDQIGIPGNDPGSAWPVGEVSDGTKEHTLIRKPEIVSGNGGDWVTSAGTNSSDSEWLVWPQDYWDDIGVHTIN